MKYIWVAEGNSTGGGTGSARAGGGEATMDIWSSLLDGSNCGSIQSSSHILNSASAESSFHDDKTGKQVRREQMAEMREPLLSSAANIMAAASDWPGLIWSAILRHKKVAIA